MEITLLTMDVTAPSPGPTSSTNSQPGDNASTFAQLLSGQSQNAQSDKKTAHIEGQSPKENKAHLHSEENKNKSKEDDNSIVSVATQSLIEENLPQEKSPLALSLPDNEQFAGILENKTAPSLMSAEELAAELPVQLAGLPGLKRGALTPEHLAQSLQQSHLQNRENGLASLVNSVSKDSDVLSDLNLSDKQHLVKSDEKSLLAQLRPETAALATQGSSVAPNEKPAKKTESFASLLTPTAEKVNSLLNGDKQLSANKLTENAAQQVVAANSVAERDLHNTLSTSSSFASHAIAGTQTSAINQPQVHFSPMATQVLNAQVGTPEWQQQLNQQIVMFSRNGLQKAELRLHPEELGSLHIRMKIEDGQAQLHLASQNGQVRAVLENAIHHLRQALSENGIQLTQSQVSSDSQDGWQQENMSDSSQFSGDGADNHQGSEGNSLQLASETALQKITLTPQELASARGGVDIFA